MPRKRTKSKGSPTKLGKTPVKGQDIRLQALAGQLTAQADALKAELTTLAAVIRGSAGTVARIPLSESPAGGKVKSAVERTNSQLDEAKNLVASIVDGFLVSAAAQAETIESETGADAGVERADSGVIDVNWEEQVLLIGGCDEFEEVPYVESLLHAAGEFCWSSWKRNLASPRSRVQAIGPAGEDGLALVIGGFCQGQHLNTCELLPIQDSDSDEGDAITSKNGHGMMMNFKRSGAACARLGSAVYMFGGFDGKQAIKFVEVLQAGPNGWSDCEKGWREVHMMKDPRFQACAVSHDGKIYVFGGFSGEKVLATASVFIPDGDEACTGGVGKWQSLPDMPRPRMASTAIKLQNKIVLVGGTTESGSLLSVVDVFDLESGQWLNPSTIPPLQPARQDAAVFVQNEKIWAVGGSNKEGWLQSCVVYDPATQEWSDGPVLPSTLACCGSILLASS